MKVLLTGGTGYIGSHTAVELIQQGYEVEIVDNLSNSKSSVLDSIAEITGVKPVFYQVDLLNAVALDEVFKNGNYDLVIHFAGLKAVGESVEQPLKYYENNVTGTINLLKCMDKYKVKELIFSSSATVYGDPENPKYVETMETGRKLASPYGKTKYMVEEILKDYAGANGDFEVILLRYFNPVGNHNSGLLGEDPNGKPNNLMPIIMRVAQGKIEKLMIFGDDYDTPDGTCRRDYIHVVDLAKGHVAAIGKMKAGVNVYNLGCGSPKSVFEMVKAFEKASGKKLPYEVTSRRAGDLAEFYADPSRAEKELNWKAVLTIEDAMNDTIKYLNNIKER